MLIRYWYLRILDENFEGNLVRLIEFAIDYDVAKHTYVWESADGSKRGMAVGDEDAMDASFDEKTNLRTELSVLVRTRT